MNYLAAAKERNLDLADLPKTLQIKIKQIQELNTDYKKIKVPKEKLKHAELENLNLIEQKISELDAYLVKKVKLFDATKYQARIDSFNSMMAKRKEAKASIAEKKEVIEENLAVLKESVNIEIPVQEPIEELLGQQEELVVFHPQYQPETEPKQEPEQEPEQQEPEQPELEEQETYEPVYQRPQHREYEEQYEEGDEEEFHKYGDAKPKKVVSKGMILMGVGFLLLTWGAVNVFKDRRG